MSEEGYRALNENDQEFYKRHAEGIYQAVHEVFKPFPDNFELKPVAIQMIQGCGTFYPNGEFAEVSFNLGGYPLFDEDHKPIIQKPSYMVDPTPSKSAFE